MYGSRNEKKIAIEDVGLALTLSPKEVLYTLKIYPRICSFWKIEPRSRAQARPSAPVSPKTRLRPRSVVTWLSVAQIVSKASLVFSS